MATLTAYPDPHPETSTVDGHVFRGGVSEDWATIISGAGTGFADSSDSVQILVWAASTTNKWLQVRRGIILYDTSSLGSGANISATVLSLYGYDKGDDLSITPNIDIYTSTPASNTGLANADYSQVGSVSQTGSPIAYGSWTLTGYNDFTFNATGRGNISKTDISKFGTRNANYDVSGTPPTWSAGVNLSHLTSKSAEFANTTQDPKLVVTYTVEGVTDKFFLMFD